MKGKVELKPLTVFVGPNNSGKSYVARLVHVIIRSLSDGSFFSKFDFNMRKKLDKMFEQARDDLDRYSTTVSIAPDAETLQTMVDPYIKRHFATELRNLVRTGAEKSRLQITCGAINASLNFSEEGVHFSVPGQEINLRFRLVAGPDDTCRVVDRDSHLEVQVGRITKSESSILACDIAQHLYGPQLSNMGAFYLPTSRSGMLQAYGSLKRLTETNILRPDIQKSYLPGAVMEFIDFIDSCGMVDTGPFAVVARDLEKDLLHGEVNLVDSLLTREITFKQNNREFSLYESSSTVLDLAPLILCLKHMVGHNSLLTIEEPETQLHPHNQVILARCIVHLIRMGLNVLLTTHSQFLLEELSHLLEAARLAPKQRKLVGLREDDYLSPSDIAVYAFEMGTNGTKIRPLDMSAEDGIEQEEFVRVSMMQYDQLQKLRRWVDDNQE